MSREVDNVAGVQQQRWWWLAVSVAAVLTLAGHPGVGAQAQNAPAADTALVQVGETDVREWLTVLSSDAMQGRAAFTEGYGLAAGYVAEQLRKIGAVPMGPDGSFFQPVNQVAYRVTRNSRIVVEAHGETRTFMHGEHVSFPVLAGSPQTLTFTGVDFAGYGLPATPTVDSGTDPRAGRLVVLLPGTPAESGGRTAAPAWTSVLARAENLLQTGAAGAAITFGAVQPSSGEGGGGNRRTTPTVDLTTVLHVDRPRPPIVTADESFMDFLLAGAPDTFADLRGRAERGQPLETFTLPDVKVTIDIDHSYEVISIERTRNVVAMVAGSDPVLRDTYVLFGAHLDHVGAATGGRAPGRVNVPVDRDPIWNGADDDGSGSVAVLAIAKALATGPRPKRSALFIWHAAEEEGLLGSQAQADDPAVPLDRIQAVFNIDMIGRNKDDDPSQADTVFVIGADRISTDLHNVIVDANQAATRPLHIDYFYNDPDDRESFYTRSDHHSYASHGIPAAFFFTGTHPDYHANTDTVDKILFPKLVRVAQLVYEAGFRVADRASDLRRDNLGPRSGRGFQGPLAAP